MKYADYVVINGDIQTCRGDGGLVVYQAMAVSGEKILAMGSNPEINAYCGENTVTIDAGGKTILPGLCDAHLHASATLEWVSEYHFYDTCEGEHTRAEVLSMVKGTIRRYMENCDISSGIRITGWNPVVFLNSKEGLPTAKDLDEVCSEVPVVLRSICQHYMWVNSKALEKAKVTRETKTPENGIIYRDEEGNPTGMFQELPAVNMMKEILPEADHTVEEYRNSILLFQSRFANPMGITMICDALATPNAVQAYKKLAQEGKLTMRVSGVYAADSDKPESQFEDFIAKKDTDSIGDIYHRPTVKFFVDGVEFMFYMCEPFEKEANCNAGYPEDYRGYPQWEEKDMKRIFTKLDAAGFQIHVHAMGDGAVKETLDAFEYVRKENPDTRNRHVIAHVMNIRPEDRKRMADLDVTASMQPCWTAMDSTEERNVFLMGKDRIREAYPMGLLQRDGVRLASGTDFPIVPILNPFLGMQMGMTRRIPRSHPDYADYGQVLRGGQEYCVDWEGMLSSYTINGAYQMFFDDVTGEIAEGKSADFVILPQRLSEVPLEEYEQLRPERVFFKGKEIYHSEHTG